METLDPSHLAPRTVAESQSEMAEVVLPNDTNPLGNLLGGRLMHFIDVAGAMAAHRHARSYVVTAAMDHIDFLAPVNVGDLLILRSSVNRAFHTSMEVGVKCWVENYMSGTRRSLRTGQHWQAVPQATSHRTHVRRSSHKSASDPRRLVVRALPK